MNEYASVARERSFPQQVLSKLLLISTPKRDSFDEPAIVIPISRTRPPENAGRKVQVLLWSNGAIGHVVSCYAFIQNDRRQFEKFCAERKRRSTPKTLTEDMPLTETRESIFTIAAEEFCRNLPRCSGYASRRYDDRVWVLSVGFARETKCCCWKKVALPQFRSDCRTTRNSHQVQTYDHISKRRADHSVE